MVGSACACLACLPCRIKFLKFCIVDMMGYEIREAQGGGEVGNAEEMASPL